MDYYTWTELNYMTDMDDQTWTFIEQLTGLGNWDWIVLYDRQEYWTRKYIGQLTGLLDSDRYDLMYGNKRIEQYKQE